VLNAQSSDPDAMDRIALPSKLSKKFGCLPKSAPIMQMSDGLTYTPTYGTWVITTTAPPCHFAVLRCCNSWMLTELIGDAIGGFGEVAGFEAVGGIIGRIKPRQLG
jgi:hypothetical protein